jgi:hypothetical protein
MSHAAAHPIGQAFPSRSVAVSPNPNDVWRETFQFDDNFRESLSALALRSIEQRFGPLEGAVGFVAKSAFWLGVVYSAIPFDLGNQAHLPQ